MNITKTIQSAIHYHQSGDLQQAESLYKKILKKQPSNADILHNLGMIYSQMGNHQQAIQYFRKAVHLTPRIFFMHYNLGNSLRAIGHDEEATNSYLTAIECNPEFIDSYNNLVIILQSQGQLDKGLSYYEKAIHLNPNFAEDLYKLALTFHNQLAFDDAIKCYQKSVPFLPFRADLYANLGVALYEKLRIEEAALYFQKAIQLNPNLDAGYFYLGMIFKEKGQYDKALTYFQKTLQINQNFTWAYTIIGVILQMMGQLEKAQTYFQKAIYLNPNICAPSNNFATLLQEKETIAHVMRSCKKTGEQKILIVANAFNRKEITQLSLAQTKRYKTSSCHFQVYDDHSTEYDASFLLPYADELIKLPQKMGCGNLRWHQFRKFLETDFDFLYLIDNDVVHDPHYIAVLVALYEAGNGKLPVTLYNGIFTSQPGMLLYYKNSMFLKTTAPGCSMFFNRNMVQNILENYKNDKGASYVPWDNKVVGYLNLPWISPEISYVDHYGASGISNINYDRDSAVNPTQYLHKRRNVILEYLTKDIDIQINF
jgi:tetratricopeptide (TPR) repeat protein